MFPVSKLIISISKNQQHHFVAQIDDFKKKGNQQKGIHELKFVEAVRACGVSFKPSGGTRREMLIGHP